MKLCNRGMNRPPPNGIKVLHAPAEERTKQEIDQLGGKHEGLATALAAEALVARQAEEISRQRDELRQEREDLRHDREVLRHDRQQLMQELVTERKKLDEERAKLLDATEQANQLRSQLRQKLQEEIERERKQALEEIAAMRDHARAEASALHARSIETWNQARTGAAALYEQAREHAKHAQERAQERARADSEKASSELKIAGEAVTQTLAVMKQSEELRQLVARPPQPQKSGAEVFGSLAETALGFFWNVAEGLLKENPESGKDLLGALASRIGHRPAAPAAIAPGEGPAAAAEASAAGAPQPAQAQELGSSKADTEKPTQSATRQAAVSVADMAFLSQNQQIAIEVMGEMAAERSAQPGDLPLPDVLAAVRERISNPKPPAVELVNENP